MAGDGRFVVTWESNNQDGNGAGVYRQEYFASGVPDGGELPVNTTTAGNQQDPAVAMDDSGGYVVAWSGNGPSDSDGVWERRFAAPASGTISGTVYHDVDGDGNLAGAATFASTTVHLFRDLGGGTIDALDLLQASLATATGGYTFTGLGAGTYFVVVDSRSLGAANVWAEQTYGVAGAALGAGFTTTDGALFGGRERLGAGTSDGATFLNPATAEHIIKVTLAAGAGESGVDFGFSLNAITTARDGDDDLLSPDRSVQGSLRQFIHNANVTAGLQTADFSIGGGGSAHDRARRRAAGDHRRRRSSTRDDPGGLRSHAADRARRHRRGDAARRPHDHRPAVDGARFRDQPTSLGDGIYITDGGGNTSPATGSAPTCERHDSTAATRRSAASSRQLGANNVVGGTGPTDRNVIAGNAVRRHLDRRRGRHRQPRPGQLHRH